jgi:hypothetical protein
MDNQSDPAQVLQAAVAAHYSQRAKQQWQLVARESSIDWYATAREAFRSGLAPLLYSTLDQTPSTTVPAEVMTNLRDAYYETASTNTVALHQLERSLNCLAENGIPVIVLKGAALLLSVYTNVALRPMVDLDLLIPFDSLDDALESLDRLGYSRHEPFPIYDESGLFWNKMLLDSENASVLELELHWHVLDNPYYAQRIRAQELNDRTIPLSGNDVVTRGLSPEDQIIHLCSHNLYHHLGRFKRAAVDVAFVASFYESTLDWDRLLRNAVENDMIMAAQVTLIPAAIEWYAPIPDRIISALHRYRPSFIERFFVTSQRSGFLKEFRTLITLPGARLKYRFFKGQLFPSKEFMAWRYGTTDSTPKPLAYGKRYASGFSRLMDEIMKREKPT